MQVSPQHFAEDAYPISDTESDISDMRDRVYAIVESRRVVRGLPSTPIVTLVASPVRVASSSIASVDREARAKYMREWQAMFKARRIEARAVALVSPRRSPRLAA